MTNTARFRPLLLLAMLVALLSSGAVAKSSSEKRMLRTAAVSSPSHGRRELFSFSWLAAFPHPHHHSSSGSGGGSGSESDGDGTSGSENGDDDANRSSSSSWSNNGDSLSGSAGGGSGSSGTSFSAAGIFAVAVGAVALVALVAAFLITKARDDDENNEITLDGIYGAAKLTLLDAKQTLNGAVNPKRKALLDFATDSGLAAPAATTAATATVVELKPWDEESNHDVSDEYINMSALAAPSATNDRGVIQENETYSYSESDNENDGSDLMGTDYVPMEESATRANTAPIVSEPIDVENRVSTMDQVNSEPVTEDTEGLDAQEDVDVKESVNAQETVDAQEAVNTQESVDVQESVSWREQKDKSVDIQKLIHGFDK